MTYFSAQTDFTFKKVFGEDSEVLLHFLNSILSLKEEKIVALEYLNDFKTPNTPFRRCNVINTRCCSDKSREFTVEVGILWSHLDNLPIVVDAEGVRVVDESRKYSFDMPHYSLLLINRAINNSLEGYYHHFPTVWSGKSGEKIDNLELIYIELEKFSFIDYDSEEIENLQLLWLRFLSDIENFVVSSKKMIWEIPEFKRSTVRLVSGSYDKYQSREYYALWHSLIVENNYDFEFVRSSESVRKIKLQNIKEMSAAIRKAARLEQLRLVELERKRGRG